MKSECLICERIKDCQQRTTPFFVKELKSGYVVIGDYQAYKGYTLFLCRLHIDEFHKLDSDFRTQFMADLSLVGKAVYNAFKAEKLNYELLGNTQKNHIHWHIFPRRNTDPGPRGPVWLRGKDAVFSEDNKPNEFELRKLREKLRRELEVL